MAERMLIVVDVQNDFCEGGALAVTGGAEVAARVAAHLRDHATDYDRILFTQDWHRPDTDNGGHFAAEPDYVDSWPVHCVAGTDGAELHPLVASEVEQMGERAERVRKGYGRPDYSAAQGALVGCGADETLETEAVTGQDVGELLRAGDFEIDVVGLAFDYCVRATAIDAAAAGARVTVLRDLAAAVSPDNDEQVLGSLAVAGVQVW